VQLSDDVLTTLRVANTNDDYNNDNDQAFDSIGRAVRPPAQAQGHHDPQRASAFA
jgi:hypothetical protein